MSYAAVASQNLPPAHEQPKPDPALLTTPADVSSSPDIAQDEHAKVHVVPADYQPFGSKAAQPPSPSSEEDEVDVSGNGRVRSDDSKKRKAKKQANRAYREAQAEGIYIWESLKYYLLRPGVAGGLVGLRKSYIYTSATNVQKHGLIHFFSFSKHWPLRTHRL
jgi:hypothetical protein